MTFAFVETCHTQQNAHICHASIQKSQGNQMTISRFACGEGMFYFALAAKTQV